MLQGDEDRYAVSTEPMSRVFSARAHVQGMLTFEAALARAEAHTGIIPHMAADAIMAACRVEEFDIAALFQQAIVAGTPAIPLVRMLIEKVGDGAGAFVHWGATSQDAIDSALMLQMREGLDLLVESVLTSCAECARLAEQHRQTLMVGRTLLQHAIPITFGLKAARWLSLLVRQVQALQRCRRDLLAVQLGGAVGTLAALGDAGLQVQKLLSEELSLPVPDLPWHTERDRIAEIASALGILAGAQAKIALDLLLLAQTEVGEVQEALAPGKGGSSAMPQKHNPVDATAALTAARLAQGVVPTIVSAMVQEHERAAGSWQAEWVALPDLFRFTAAAVEHVHIALQGLQVDSTQMRAQLDEGGGLLMAESLTMALARHSGRPEAQRIVQKLVAHTRKAGISLQQAALDDTSVRAMLAPEEIQQAFDAEQYLGSTDVFIDRALTAYSMLQVRQERL